MINQKLLLKILIQTKTSCAVADNQVKMHKLKIKVKRTIKFNHIRPKQEFTKNQN